MRKRLGGQTLGKGPCWDKRRPDSLQDWKEVRTQVHADPEIGGQLTKSTSPHPKVSWGVRKAGSPPVQEVESGGGGSVLPRRSHWLPKGAPPAGARGQHEPGNGSRGGQLPGTDLEAQADTRPGPGPALRAAGRQLRPRSEGHTHGWTAGDPGGPGTHGVTTASGLGPLGPSTLCAQEPLSLLLAGQPKLRSTGQATGAQDRVTTALRGITGNHRGHTGL